MILLSFATKRRKWMGLALCCGCNTIYFAVGFKKTFSKTFLSPEKTCFESWKIIMWRTWSAPAKVTHEEKNDWFSFPAFQEIRNNDSSLSKAHPKAWNRVKVHFTRQAHFRATVEELQWADSFFTTPVPCAQQWPWRLPRELPQHSRRLDRIISNTDRFPDPFTIPTWLLRLYSLIQLCRLVITDDTLPPPRIRTRTAAAMLLNNSTEARKFCKPKTARSEIFYGRPF